MARRKRQADPGKAVGVIRVSTGHQALSPEAQRDAIERWCAANGCTLVAVFQDQVTGAAPLDKRPGLLTALGALAEHGAGVLVVAKRDRLARDPMVAAMAEAGAKRVGARVVSAAGEGTDSDDPTAILMRRIVDAFAEYERLVIKARIKSAMAVKRSRGEALGGTAPYGYRLAADGVAVEPDPAEQSVIARVQALRDEGLSIRAVADRLNADRVPARGKRWHPTTVARLVDRDAA